MKRRQAANTQEKGAQVMRLRLAELYGGMISSRLREDASLPVLAQSIARHGLLQPIVVQKNPENDRYMLVCGARRLAACRMLGLEEIDAIRIPGGKPEAAACFLEEHFTRRRPSLFKEAELLSRPGVAARCCMPEGEVRRRLAVLELDEQTRNAAERCGLSLEQVELLRTIEPEERRLEAVEILGRRESAMMQAHRFFVQPEDKPEGGRRRAVRRAAEEAQRLCDALNAQGMNAGVSLHAQGRGLCIQILIRNE